MSPSPQRGLDTPPLESGWVGDVLVTSRAQQGSKPGSRGRLSTGSAASASRPGVLPLGALSQAGAGEVQLPRSCHAEAVGRFVPADSQHPPQTHGQRRLSLVPAPSRRVPTARASSRRGLRPRSEDKPSPCSTAERFIADPTGMRGRRFRPPSLGGSLSHSLSDRSGPGGESREGRAFSRGADKCLLLRGEGGRAEHEAL